MPPMRPLRILQFLRQLEKMHSFRPLDGLYHYCTARYRQCISKISHISRIKGHRWNGQCWSMHIVHSTMSSLSNRPAFCSFTELTSFHHQKLLTSSLPKCRIDCRVAISAPNRRNLPTPPTQILYLYCRQQTSKPECYIIHHYHTTFWIFCTIIIFL